MYLSLAVIFILKMQVCRECQHDAQKIPLHHHRPRKRAAEPLTPILPDAHDRIFTVGYSYYPVHTEIYGTYRPRSTR